MDYSQTGGATPDQVIMYLMADRPMINYHASRDGRFTISLQYRIGHSDWVVVRTTRKANAYNSFARVFDGFDGAARYYERFV